MWPSTPAERRHLALRYRTYCLRRFRASRPPQHYSFRGSIPHPIRSLCTLRIRRRRRLRNTRFPAARYHLTGAGLSPAGTRQLRLTHRNWKFELSVPEGHAIQPRYLWMLRKSTAFVPRYYKFESISLQRRVTCEPVSGGNPPSYVEKPRFSAGVRAGASGAVGRDVQDAATSGLTGGNISVVLYSSTAPPVMWAA